MTLNERGTIGGGSKTEAKTRHSGTVNRWAAVIFTPFSSTDFSHCH